MGYTTTIMQPTMDILAQMQTNFGQLITALQDDANSMARVTGDLVAHNFQGPKAISLVSMTQNYETLLHSHAFDRLQQLSQICKTYQQAIETACTTFDSLYPQGNNDYAEYVFNNSDLTYSVPYDLPKADQDVNKALSGTASGYTQQFEQQMQANHVKLNRSMLMDIQDEISSTGDALYTWADALNTAFNQWQKALSGADVHAVDIPTLTYDDGTGKMVSVPIDTGYEQSLISAFNQQGNGSITETLNPEAYLLLTQLDQVYTDPNTQQALKVLVSTPTGMQFAEYYLYMGKKFGNGFISWAHEGPNVGAQTTPGGFVVLNLDANQSEYETAGDLVHEGVESYFDGQGIRQMNTRHADYVAEWYQGKFLSEAGQSPDFDGHNRAYGLTYDQWWNKQLEIDKMDKAQNPPGHNVYLDEGTDVTLYSDGSTLDRPGAYWQGSSGWDSFTHDYLGIGNTDVSGIPNPMGLDPRMLLSNDLIHNPKPPLPPPPATSPHGW